jgi:hypothetical protein
MSAWGKAWGSAWGSAWGVVYQPQSGPSGGISWLRGYVPRHQYIVRPTPREQDARDEIAVLLALIV